MQGASELRSPGWPTSGAAGTSIIIIIMYRRTRERQASDSRASVHKLRISPAVKILERTSEEPGKLLEGGAAFRRAQHSMPCGPLAPTSSRLDAAGGPWPMCLVFLGGGGRAEPPVLALTLKQLREQFHRTYPNTAEASKTQMQSTMQDAIVGETIHGTSNMFCLRERFSP